MLWFLSLIAAIVTPHAIEAGEKAPPLSYELTLSLAYVASS